MSKITLFMNVTYRTGAFLCMEWKVNMCLCVVNGVTRVVAVVRVELFFLKCEWTNSFPCSACFWTACAWQMAPRPVHRATRKTHRVIKGRGEGLHAHRTRTALHAQSAWTRGTVEYVCLCTTHAQILHTWAVYRPGENVFTQKLIF